MELILKTLDYKIVRYILVGGVSTLIHVVAAYLYIYLVNDSSVFVSNIIGFFSAFGFSYIVQSKLVYKRAISYRKAFKYFVVQFISLLLVIFISDYAFVGNSYIKVLLVVVLLPILTYITHNIWTFAEPNSTREFR